MRKEEGTLPALTTTRYFSEKECVIVEYGKSSRSKRRLFFVLEGKGFEEEGGGLTVMMEERWNGKDGFFKLENESGRKGRKGAKKKERRKKKRGQQKRGLTSSPLCVFGKITSRSWT